MCKKFLVSTEEKLAFLIPKALSRTVKTEAKEQELDRNQALSHSIHIVGSYLLPILVCWDCYNKIPQTGCLLNNRNLFLPVLKALSPKARWQFLVRLSCLLAVSSPTGERGTKLWGLLLLFLWRTLAHTYGTEKPGKKPPTLGENLLKRILADVQGKSWTSHPFICFTLSYSACPDGTGSSRARVTRLTQFGTRSTHTCKVSACG